MLTAETITDEQIREVRRAVAAVEGFGQMRLTDALRLIDDCDEALWDEHIQSKEIAAARARIAEFLNARAKAGAP